MGIISRLKRTLTQTANAAIDKATDPAKELDLAIAELEEGRKKALAELISYKASAKMMDEQLASQRKRAEEWEARAMAAIKAGDDELAKQALREKKACEAEIAKISRDRAEATGYAAQLNKSRKEFETRLQMFKLRKGTLATSLAAARSGGGDAFGNDSSVWDRFAEAEDKIDRAAIESEVDSALRGEPEAEAAFERDLAALTAADGDAGDAPGDPLAELKQRMQRERATKALAAKGDGANDADPGEQGS
ncbi:MAG: PspA/IM30 family protein [Kofleriaceae bacterium]